MSAGRLAGLVVAAVMVLGGGYLALTGLGYLGDEADPSGPASIGGSLVAGLGIALAITVLQRRP